jgi:hypothetical protein
MQPEILRVLMEVLAQGGISMGQPIKVEVKPPTVDEYINHALTTCWPSYTALCN